MVIISAKPGIRVQVHFKAGSLERISLFHSRNFCLDAQDHDATLMTWLQDYARGKFSPMPLPLPINTFQGEVLRFLQTIPWGSVLSYKEVAEGVGNPRAARAIGNICRGNPFPLLIPCHRVIRSDGEIGRYTPDLSLKKELLHFEGVATEASS